MKNIILLLFSLVLLLAACQKNQDFIDTEIDTETTSADSLTIDSVSWWSVVYDMESAMHYDALLCGSVQCCTIH